jgi:hypothetical protein
VTQETPTAPRTSAASKRNHAAMAGDDNTGSDDEHGSGGALPLNLTLPNQNVVAAAKHYAEKKRLRGDQLTELGSFLKVSRLILTLYRYQSYSFSLVKEPASLREAKLLTNIFALGNQLEQVVASKPSFELSPDLEVCFSLRCRYKFIYELEFCRRTFRNTPQPSFCRTRLLRTRVNAPRLVLRYVFFLFDLRRDIHIHCLLRRSSRGSGLSPTGWRIFPPTGAKSSHTLSTHSPRGARRLRRWSVWIPN